ncbi:DUF7687 domain-containing protein [Paracoccus sediminis]|uniref:Uncharacterized protein n=2 Tax=Paracoccus sediminis TaxID=1214787 RepID=A0A238UMR1_9RHOB|nr:hypothetical protein [Paracoccus sediminis]SNR23318.1 hypothetical protein SAMN06265378_101145 [Paracoccus sediminis]
MRPDERFLNKPKSFWACVRSISQTGGYTQRGGSKSVKVHDLASMREAFKALELRDEVLRQANGKPTSLAAELMEYFQYRADVLNNHVRVKLMDVDEARQVFSALNAKLRPSRAVPMNKQKGEKKSEAYLTGMVNMLIEAHAEGLPCNYDPRSLTTITENGVPIRTLARRVDGAFPTTVNPVAVWEIKEYYYTTTFGSRVADGVYESLLDGMEVEELRESEGIDVKHYLMVDSHFTWWECGRSYLCRMVDMLHMGYVDEILFGKEVVEEMPRIMAELVQMVRDKGGVKAEPD